MKNLAYFVFIFTILLASTVSASTYTLSYYSTNTSATDGTVQGISVKEGEGCNVTLTERGYFTGTNFDIGVNYYSPDSTQIGTATRTGLTQIICSSFGTYSTSTDLNSYLEGYADYTASADDGNLTLSSIYSCTETGLYYDIIADMNDVDSFGNVPYRYGGSSTGFVSNATLTAAAYESNYYNCFSTLHTRPPYISISSGGSGSADYRRTAYAYYPFNSGSEGIVEYWFDLGNATVNVLDCSDSCTGTQSGYFDVFLVNVEDESYTSLYATSGDCIGGFEVTGELEGSLTLDSDTEYMIVTASRNDDAGAVFPCVRSYTHREPLGFNISVYVYQPDWNCTDWSACISGEQQRICTDLNGIATPKTEFQTCSVTVLENATLGFEAFVRDADVWKCTPDWAIIGCNYQLNETYRDSPLNWSIGENSFAKRDFLKMTEEWSTEGSRSLKMWYIPPKQGEVQINSTGYPISCGNATSGTVPYVYQNISNDTFSVSFNVTFPAENMLLSLEVKGCPEQALQHTDFYNTLLFVPTGLCPERCYANTCNGTPNSRYIINMLDTTTGSSVFGTPFFSSASINRADQISLDMSNLGLVVGRDYTLTLAVYPENLDDASGNCVYFDNVRYERIGESFVDDFLGGTCASQCIGVDYYEATLLSNGECSVKKVEYGCSGDQINEALDNGEDICNDDNTLLRLNPKTLLPEEINCEYGCEDNGCLTESEETETTDTPTTTLEWAMLLVSPAFLFSYLIAFITIVIALKRENSWPIALFGIGQLIFVFSIYNIISQWFAVGEILLACVIFAYFVSKGHGG